MNISALNSSSQAPAADVDPESLVGSKRLTEHQKIGEASRQFEAMLLRQILSETQKPVIKSSFTDNSTAAGIYQDFITNQLSDCLSKSGGLGLAKVFERQLNHPADQAAAAAAAAAVGTSASPAVKPLTALSHHE